MSENWDIQRKWRNTPILNYLKPSYRVTDFLQTLVPMGVDRWTELHWAGTIFCLCLKNPFEINEKLFSSFQCMSSRRLKINCMWQNGRGAQSQWTLQEGAQVVEKSEWANMHIDRGWEKKEEEQKMKAKESNVRVDRKKSEMVE